MTTPRLQMIQTKKFQTKSWSKMRLHWPTPQTSWTPLIRLTLLGQGDDCRQIALSRRWLCGGTRWWCGTHTQWRFIFRVRAGTHQTKAMMLTVCLSARSAPITITALVYNKSVNSAPSQQNSMRHHSTRVPLLTMFVTAVISLLRRSLIRLEWLHQPRTLRWAQLPSCLLFWSLCCS